MALSLAFIGCGGMGRSHLRRLLEGGRVEVLGISDASPESLEAARKVVEEVAPEKLAGMTFLSDAKQMIAETPAEVAVIPLPNKLHKDFTIAALEAGKHVFCEKPMALNVADAEAMIAARDKAGKILMIGHCVRFTDQYRALKKMVEEKTYGEILRANFIRIGGNYGPLPPAIEWFLDQDASGGAVMDLHIHDADFIIYLLGRPRAVEAFGVENQLRPNSGPDQMSLHYLYDKALPYVTAETGWMRSRWFDAAFEVDFEEAVVAFGDGKLVVKKGENWGKPLPEITEWPTDPPLTMWEHFLDSVEQGKQPLLCPPEDSCFAVKMATSAVEALRGGGRVGLE